MVSEAVYTGGETVVLLRDLAERQPERYLDRLPTALYRHGRGLIRAGAYREAYLVLREAVVMLGGLPGKGFAPQGDTAALAEGTGRTLHRSGRVLPRARHMGDAVGVPQPTRHRDPARPWESGRRHAGTAGRLGSPIEQRPVTTPRRAMPTQHTVPGTPAPIRQERAVEVLRQPLRPSVQRRGRLSRRDRGPVPAVAVEPTGGRGRTGGAAGDGAPAHVPVSGRSGILEFPRGGCAPGEAPEVAAARELAEESGLVAASVRSIGRLHADTGLIGTQTHVCLAEVHPVQRSSARPDASESVAEPVWASRDMMTEWLQEGRITCGITIAAFAVATAAMAGTAGTGVPFSSSPAVPPHPTPVAPPRPGAVRG
ncbi:NUDIX hydrolase [Streptomyces sp. CA-243310]|uniref:NUDIX hydrolase n=1 Tax=Streptomyces sp. CA-243310 TaxID=3240056 RepID=UPI003D8E11CE